jgi:DNA-binding transcriptional LysR family regulator
MDRLKQMEAFVAAADHGTLAAAARAVGVTPAMLGRHIDALERRLEVRLLHRTTRRIALTEEGQLFVEQCRRLFGDLARAEDLVRAGRHTAVGHLRVTAPAGFGRRHVAVHAPSFLALHPQVELSCNLSDRVVDLLREGFDLGIRIGGNLDPDMVAVRLASNRRVVCAAPAYLARRGVPQSPADLAGHDCLVITPDERQAAGTWSFRHPEPGRVQAVRVHGKLDCNDGELLHRWACEGLGLAWRSTWEIQGELLRGELVTVLEDFALPDYDIRAVVPRGGHIAAKVRFFIDHLRGIYAEPGYWTRQGSAMEARMGSGLAA